MKVPITKFKEEKNVKKYSKRLLALLLACIMVLACGVTAFADEIPSVTYKYPKPNTWFVTGVDGGDSYTNVIKVPCKGTLITFV